MLQFQNDRIILSPLKKVNEKWLFLKYLRTPPSPLLLKKETIFNFFCLAPHLKLIIVIIFLMVAISKKRWRMKLAKELGRDIAVHHAHEMWQPNRFINMHVKAW